MSHNPLIVTHSIDDGSAFVERSQNPIFYWSAPQMPRRDCLWGPVQTGSSIAEPWFGLRSRDEWSTKAWMIAVKAASNGAGSSSPVHQIPMPGRVLGADLHHPCRTGCSHLVCGLTGHCTDPSIGLDLRNGVSSAGSRWAKRRSQQPYRACRVALEEEGRPSSRRRPRLNAAAMTQAARAAGPNACRCPRRSLGRCGEAWRS